MRLPHFILAVLLMVIWGIQFIMIEIAITAISPFLLCCLRFFFTSVPIVFFIARPKIPFRLLLSYGLFTFAAQYGCLFFAMHTGMPAGLAALVYQMQVFINIGLAYFFFKERITITQLIGILVAFSGLGVVCFHLGGKGATVLGFTLILLATFLWACGNMISKKFGTTVHAVSLVVWGNFVSVPPMLLMCWLNEGQEKLMYAVHHFSWLIFLAVAYIVYFSTLIGFSLWSFLLSIYPVKTVVPFMLLVPPISMVSAFFLLNEPLPAWKLYAAALILGGLAINFFGRYLVAIWKRSMD